MVVPGSKLFNWGVHPKCKIVLADDPISSCGRTTIAARGPTVTPMTAIATPAPIIADEIPRADTLECFRVGTIAQPDSPREPEKMHPRLNMELDVVAGVVYLVAGDEETVLTPGDHASVPAGVFYSRWNAGDDQARWVETFSRR